ncbi:N-acetyltransferase family protein [Humidisolicoccus flavus]|uniref:GNAT family N-acetyltransferase n=1 Tax=Humidisolicoccus flavus TaxID=3111414 RepID=UPI0032448C0B
MLPEEYEQRRRLPRELQAAPFREPDFSFTLRDATDADLAQVRDIYKHYVLNSTVSFDERPKTIAQWRATFVRVTKLGMPFLVAESATGTILGFAFVQPWKQRSAYRHTVEDSIYLGPTAVGRGLGGALLALLIERCQEAGIREIVAVIADQQTEGSIRLHERFGFVEAGRMGRVGFKFGRWLGIVMMQKSLESPKERAKLAKRAAREERRASS